MPINENISCEGNNIKVFVVLHPIAGKCNPAAVRKCLIKSFVNSGCGYQFYETTGKENLPDVVRNALSNGFTLFVVAGGDGTVSDVAEGLVHTDIPLAIIPVGTGNVLARELWIPMNISKACRLIFGDHSLACVDAMLVGNRYYFQTLSAGFASLMIRDTRREHKRIYGVAAYLWTGLISLLGFQPRKFEIKYDGQIHVSSACEVAIMNAGTLARRPILLNKNIRVDDGEVDICIIRGRTIFNYLTLAIRIMTRIHKYAKNIEFLKAKKNVLITTDEPILVQADGEIIGTTPVDVKIIPRAINIIVPRNWRADSEYR
jgi:diacylglycerol kinase (ATP)